MYTSNMFSYAQGVYTRRIAEHVVCRCVALNLFTNTDFYESINASTKTMVFAGLKQSRSRSGTIRDDLHVGDLRFWSEKQFNPPPTGGHHLCFPEGF